MPLPPAPRIAWEDLSIVRTPSGEPRRLGSGSFGVVLEAVYRGARVAVKQATHLTPALLDALQLEAALQARLSRAHIAHVFGLAVDDRAPARPRYGLVIEFADGGDALAATRSRAARGRMSGAPHYFPEHVLWRWGAQLLTAIAALHARSIIHRDVKAANCLLFSRRRSGSDRRVEGRDIGDDVPSPADAPSLYDLKLSDLGVARGVGAHAGSSPPRHRSSQGGHSPGGTSVASGGGGGVLGEVAVPHDWLGHTLSGTPLYMAPELLGARGPAYGPATDVYSAGVTLYELSALSPPFSGPSMHALTAAVLSARAPQLPTSGRGRGVGGGFSPAWCAFISSLMERSPRSRPTAADAARTCREWLADAAAAAVTDDVATPGAAAAVVVVEEERRRGEQGGYVARSGVDDAGVRRRSSGSVSTVGGTEEEELRMGAAHVGGGRRGRMMEEEVLRKGGLRIEPSAAGREGGHVERVVASPPPPPPPPLRGVLGRGEAVAPTPPRHMAHRQQQNGEGKSNVGDDDDDISEAAPPRTARIVRIRRPTKSCAVDGERGEAITNDAAPPPVPQRSRASPQRPVMLPRNVATSTAAVLPRSVCVSPTAARRDSSGPPSSPVVIRVASPPRRHMRSRSPPPFPTRQPSLPLNARRPISSSSPVRPTPIPLTATAPIVSAPVVRVVPPPDAMGGRKESSPPSQGSPPPPTLRRHNRVPPPLPRTSLVVANDPSPRMPPYPPLPPPVSRSEAYAAQLEGAAARNVAMAAAAAPAVRSPIRVSARAAAQVSPVPVTVAGGGPGVVPSMVTLHKALPLAAVNHPPPLPPLCGGAQGGRGGAAAVAAVGGVAAPADKWPWLLDRNVGAGAVGDPILRGIASAVAEEEQRAGGGGDSRDARLAARQKREALAAANRERWGAALA